MRREDVRKVFPDATDEQVDGILNGIRDELNPLKASVRELTGRLEGATTGLEASQASEAGLRAQLADVSRQLEERMTDEERLAARERAAEEREQEFLRRSAELDAKAIFVSAGFGESDMEVLLPRVVSADSEATKAAAQALVDLDASRRKAAEQAARDELLKGNPRNQGGGKGGAAMSRDEFKRLPLAEQVRMRQENPDILKQLT